MIEKIPIRKIHETRSEPSLTRIFNIREISNILAGKDMVEDLHRHEFFLILAIKKGAGNHEIDFVNYDVTDHSIFLLRPGQVHSLTIKAGSTGYIVQFKTDFYSHAPIAKELLRKVSHRKICSLEGNSFVKLGAALESMFSEYTEKLEGYEEVIKSYLNIFFTELIRHRKNTDAHLSTKSYSQEKLERFFDLLDSNITDSKQVSQYAGKLNLSTYQLGAITKSLLNKTPSDLINEHIVLEAKRQLLATANQVNEIAYQLGYDDPSYFIRFFKKHTGHSPDAFRNILK